MQVMCNRIRWRSNRGGASKVGEIVVDSKAEIFELLFESANISKFTAKEKLKYEKDMTMERDRINQLATSFLDGERQGTGDGEGKS